MGASEGNGGQRAYGGDGKQKLGNQKASYPPFAQKGGDPRREEMEKENPGQGKAKHTFTLLKEKARNKENTALEDALRAQKTTEGEVGKTDIQLGSLWNGLSP